MTEHKHGHVITNWKATENKGQQWKYGKSLERKVSAYYVGMREYNVKLWGELGQCERLLWEETCTAKWNILILNGC